MQYILDKSNNAKSAIVEENDNFYKLQDGSFLAKVLLNNNSLYELITENNNIPFQNNQNSQSQTPQQPLTQNDDNFQYTLEHFEAGKKALVSALDNAIMNTGHFGVSAPPPNQTPQTNIVDGQIRDSFGNVVNPPTTHQFNPQATNHFQHQQTNPMDDVNNVLFPSQTNVQPQQAQQAQQPYLPTYDAYSDLDRNSNKAVMDMYTTYMRNAKTKFKYKFEHIFKIPRLEYIVMTEEMNDVSFVDFIASHIVNDIFKNKKELINDIKKQITDLLPKYEDDDEILENKINNEVSELQDGVSYNDVVLFQIEENTEEVMQEIVERDSDVIVDDISKNDEEYIPDELNNDELNNKENE